MSRPWRRWTHEEEVKLYEYAVTIGQPEAAKLLGRSIYSVAQKCRLMGIKWRQGFWNLSSIAKEVGCSKHTVKRLIGIIYPDKNFFYISGNNKRYTIEHEEAERIIRILKGTRKSRQRHIRAGQARGRNGDKEDS